MANGNQLTIGGFKQTGRMVTGWISTAQINAQYVELRPAERRSDNSPSFYAWARGRLGNLYHLGTLWPKKMNRDGTPFHGGFICDRGQRVTMNVAIFGDFATGADMVSREDDDEYFPGRSYSAGGGQQQNSGGLSGGSTVGPNGEYVGHPGDAPDDLDDDVPF